MADNNPVRGINEARCRYCRLGTSHPELLAIIHQWRFGEERKTYRDITDELNKLVARDNLNLKPFHISGLTEHFTSHIPADSAVIYEIQELASKRKQRTPADPDLMHRAIEVRRQSLEKIEANLAKWQRVFQAVYQSYGLDNTDANGNPAPLSNPSKDDVDSMAKAHGVWADLITAKDRLLKDRNFTLSILQESVDYYGRNLVPPTCEAVFKARDEISAAHPEFAELAEAITKAFLDALRTAVSGLYEQTIKEIGDKYSI